jgi:ribosome-associated protein
MEEDLTINETLVIPGAELGFTASRASGPGGQHVNKTSSRVTLQWDVAGSTLLTSRQRELIEQRLASRLTRDGVLQVHAEGSRSQHRNRELARERLVELVAGALHTDPPRRATRTPRGVHRRRVANKRKRGETKRMRKAPRHDE